MILSNDKFYLAVISDLKDKRNEIEVTIKLLEELTFGIESKQKIAVVEKFSKLSNRAKKLVRRKSKFVESATPTEQEIIGYMAGQGGTVSSNSIHKHFAFAKSKTSYYLAKMSKKGFIAKKGRGTKTLWYLV